MLKICKSLAALLIPALNYKFVSSEAQNYSKIQIKLTAYSNTFFSHAELSRKIFRSTRFVVEIKTTKIWVIRGTVYHLELKFVYLIAYYWNGRLIRVQADKLLTYLEEKRIPPKSWDEHCDTRDDDVDLFVSSMYLRK